MGRGVPFEGKGHRKSRWIHDERFVTCRRRWHDRLFEISRVEPREAADDEGEKKRWP